MTNPRRILRALGHAWRMINPWVPMIRDHRERPVPLYRLDQRWRQPGAGTDLPLPVCAGMRALLLTHTRHGMGARPWAILILAAFYAAMLWQFAGRGMPRVSAWLMGCAVGVMVLAALTYGRRIPKAGRDAIARELLAERRCPSCAYDLSATTPAPDNLTTCPECGAAWRLP